MNALKFKGLLCSAAAIAGFGCAPQSADVVEVVPQDVAYCLDDPAAEKVVIMSVLTGAPVYSAVRPQAPATASRIMNPDGSYSTEPTILAVDVENCTAYGVGAGRAFTRFLSPPPTIN